MIKGITDGMYVVATEIAPALELYSFRDRGMKLLYATSTKMANEMLQEVKGSVLSPIHILPHFSFVNV